MEPVAFDRFCDFVTKKASNSRGTSKMRLTGILSRKMIHLVGWLSIGGILSFFLVKKSDLIYHNLELKNQFQVIPVETN